MKSSILFTFLLCWLIGWSTLTLLFDAFCVTNIVSGIRSGSFPSVVGTVTDSKVVMRHTDDGHSEFANVKYDYVVAGQELTGDAIHFASAMPDASHTANKTVDRFPVGCEVPVFYDPDDPQHAALIAGIAAQDFVIPLLLLPFNMVMLGLANLLTTNRRRAQIGYSNIKIRESASGIQYLVASVNRWLTVYITVGALAFISFFMFFLAQQFLPEWHVVWFLWSMILTSAAYVRFAPRSQQIALDTRRSTIQVQTRTSSATLPITAVDGCKVLGRGHDGLRRVAIFYRSDDNQAALNCKCDSTESAKWLAQELRNQLEM